MLLAVDGTLDHIHKWCDSSTREDELLIERVYDLKFYHGIISYKLSYPSNNLLLS